MKKCMEIKVEDSRTVGRLGKTWVENVEVDVAELEIDRGVHGRKKWKNNVIKR